jgi:hypothetical protein
MAPTPVVQQPEHRKARRTSEVIGADRVLRRPPRPVLFKAKCGPNNSMEPTRPAYNSRLPTHAPPNSRVRRPC